MATTIRLGDVGDDVLCLEQRLQQVRVDTDVVQVDGHFDAGTDLVVREFQTRQGLAVDGVVGPQTAERLGIWDPPEPTTTPPPVPVQPAAGPVDVYYENCDAARAAGDVNILRGEPGYRPRLDGDDDGVACES